MALHNGKLGGGGNPLDFQSSMCTRARAHTHTHTTHNTQHATILLAHDPLSSLVYPMITHTSLVAGSLPIKPLVARQRPTNTHTYTTQHTSYIPTHGYRYICKHLQQFCAQDTLKRIQYLKKLIDLDDSCSEGLEYIELLLNQGTVVNYVNN